MYKSLLVLLLSLSVNQLFAQNIKIKGSDTELPLTQMEAEAFMKKHKSSVITVNGGGSEVGIIALINGTCDIAQASRSINTDEKLKLTKENKSYKEIIIAYDAIAVIVNPFNPVSELSREQLEEIYTGKITNWKDVGGTDLAIEVFSREATSGTYELFKDSVLKHNKYTPSAVHLPATGAIVQTVSQNKGAIGYVGLAYLEKTVKPLRISYDQGKTYIAPSVAAVKNQTYPIRRPLYYYYLTSFQETVNTFIEFVISRSGQKIVQRAGFVPVK